MEPCPYIERFQFSNKFFTFESSCSTKMTDLHISSTSHHFHGHHTRCLVRSNVFSTAIWPPLTRLSCVCPNKLLLCLQARTGKYLTVVNPRWDPSSVENLFLVFKSVPGWPEWQHVAAMLASFVFRYIAFAEWHLIWLFVGALVHFQKALMTEKFLCASNNAITWQAWTSSFLAGSNDTELTRLRCTLSIASPTVHRSRCACTSCSSPPSCQ